MHVIPPRHIVWGIDNVTSLIRFSASCAIQEGVRMSKPALNHSLSAANNGEANMTLCWTRQEILDLIDQ